MRHLSLISSTLLVACLAFMVLSSGCSGGSKDKGGDGNKDETKTKTDATDKKDGADSKTVFKPGDGVIKGKIVYAGTPPECTSPGKVKETPGCLAQKPEDQFQNCGQDW